MTRLKVIFIKISCYGALSSKLYNIHKIIMIKSVNYQVLEKVVKQNHYVKNY